MYDNGNTGGAGIGANFNFEWVAFDVGYWATNPANPEERNGLFNGNYTTGANLNFSLFEERWNITVAYLRAYQEKGSGYDLAGFVGTDAATEPFSDRSNSSNNYSIATKFDITDSISIGGYFGYSTSSVEEGEADADILNWNIYTYFTDLLQEKDVILLSFGQPPTLVDSKGDAIVDDEDNPYLLNVEYRFDLTDNINIVPGVYVLFNPNGDSNNDTIYVGMIRTFLNF